MVPIENNIEQNSYENIIDEYIKNNAKDMQDLQLLQQQRQAQLLLAVGYLLEYQASMEAIEITLDRLSRRQRRFANGTYNGEAEARIDENEIYWRNAGVNADKVALMAAEVELFGQTILTYLDSIKLKRFQQNTEDRDYLLSRTANEEIFLGAVYAEIGYIFNLQGARALYQISNENPIFD